MEQDYLDYEMTKKVIDAGFDSNWVKGIKLPLALCLKWLREVRHMHIEIFPFLDPIGNAKFVVKWRYCIYSTSTSQCFHNTKDTDGGSYYEVAVKAINDCLTR